MLARTNVSQAVTDPEAFAQHVGELASKAGELASLRPLCSWILFI